MVAQKAGQIARWLHVESVAALPRMARTGKVRRVRDERSAPP